MAPRSVWKLPLVLKLVGSQRCRVNVLDDGRNAKASRRLFIDSQGGAT